MMEMDLPLKRRQNRARGIIKLAPLELTRDLAQVLHEKRGDRVTTLDVREASSIADFILIASGNVERHVLALARAMRDFMRKKGEKSAHIEGMENGDWVVLDYFEIVIHLFIPAMRQKYQLDDLLVSLWPEGKRI